ncbi:hypothetical protein KC332_g13840 [Hortaea werneckii]|uniref:Sterol 24-C-methyltransferase n=2 Tax=Hortaea werneckii TaxID=91943 RepID=A0A3M7IL24_HORWE|nr:hypothetical protein KC358_g13857 [Hortaea werneckii]OTA38706.1 hypothetical protein BTJ68_01185 [Hortaea werneckii EXF-2000]KAI6807885.1 hypothetical protein KC350_g13578 [Hortaea werneckii]KAI6811007.1 hypothetical protein KC342_g17833 [Hortaea werneckii]KAI6900429.1 hypothetical protein KC348_g16844 [Hortaea werneckii]
MAETTSAPANTATATAAGPIRPKNERAQDPNDNTHVSQAYELEKMTNAYNAHWQDQLQRRGSHTSQDRAARAADAGQVSDDYYNFVSPIYEHFWGQTFHYCPVSPGEGIQASMHDYDTMFAGLVGIKEGMKVLDVGCGVGGPARTIASEKGCFVTGVTRNEWHIERGRVLTKEAGLEGQVVHVQADFMKLPFEDASFDAVYAFDALCYAPDVKDVYAEIHRVLKPGGQFGFHDWVMTDKYQESNARHRHIRNAIEFGNGITNMPLLSHVRKSLAATGFEIQHDENMAWRSERPWWYAPGGNIRYARGWEDFQRVLEMSPLVFWTKQLMAHVLCWFGVMPKEAVQMGYTMHACVRSVANGGKLDIFTPMWVMVCKKAETEKVKGA